MFDLKQKGCARHGASRGRLVEGAVVASAGAHVEP